MYREQMFLRLCLRVSRWAGSRRLLTRRTDSSPDIRSAIAKRADGVNRRPSNPTTSGTSSLVRQSACAFKIFSVKSEHPFPLFWLTERSWTHVAHIVFSIAFNACLRSRHTMQHITPDLSSSGASGNADVCHLNRISEFIWKSYSFPLFPWWISR